MTALDTRLDVRLDTPLGRLRTPALPLLAVAALGAAAPAPAQAQAADPATTPVVVIVRVPKPWYAPRFVIAGKMRDTIDQYAGLPGLAYKAYSFEQDSGDFGGLYLWPDRARAGAWFGPEWFERVRRERGVEAQVRTFDAPLTIDNVAGGTPGDAHASAVATLVEIPVPAGLGREALVQGFRDAVPTYRAIPGLLRKSFIVSDRGTFGGVYVWRDAASAQAWFGPTWHERVRATYGQPARVEWFEVPILTPGVEAGRS